MNSVNFDRLSDESIKLSQARNGSMSSFDECAERVAKAVEAIFNDQIQSRESRPGSPMAVAFVAQSQDHVEDSHQGRVATPIDEEEAEKPPILSRVASFVMEWFQGSSNEETRSPVISVDPDMNRVVGSIVSESSLLIAGKLLTYSREGEERIAPLDPQVKDQVLERLEDVIHGTPVDTFSKALNAVIDNLRAITPENNTLDWSKVLHVAESLRRIRTAAEP